MKRIILPRTCGKSTHMAAEALRQLSGTATAAVLERRPHPVHPRFDGAPCENQHHPDAILRRGLGVGQ